MALTSTKRAPWYVIPANHKWFRDLAVSQIIADTMDEMGLKLPPAQRGHRGHSPQVPCGGTRRRRMARRVGPRTPRRPDSGQVRMPAWFFSSLQGYRIGWLPRDLVAGLMLAAIAIPGQLATARLAGMPPETGLYAFAAGSLAFAAFGANRFMSVAADSTIAPIFAGGAVLDRRRRHRPLRRAGHAAGRSGRDRPPRRRPAAGRLARHAALDSRHHGLPRRHLRPHHRRRAAGPVGRVRDRGGICWCASSMSSASSGRPIPIRSRWAPAS